MPTGPSEQVLLSTLLKKPVLDAGGSTLGRLTDVIVGLHGGSYPPVKGLVVHAADRDVFVHVADVAELGPDRIVLRIGPSSERPFERRDGEVLLRSDVLAHRLLDVARAKLVRAYDIALSPVDGGGWIASGLDVHRVGFLHLPGRHPLHVPRDWAGFEPLIGHQPSARVRAPFGTLRRLKPAQIADILESAAREEQTEILDHVHADPELEADVFEELDDDQQSRLLASRTDAQISEVLTRMRPDDAADALLDLPQDRRQPVLEALGPDQRRKVTTLLSYNETTAGGLMGVDYFTQRPDATAAAALGALRTSRTNQPEALLTIYLTDDDDRLVGAVGLVAALQADPNTVLHDLADKEPVRLHPDADVIDVITNMADYNMLTLPVVDHDHRILGLITIDDVLEAVIPENWRRREHPATNHTTPPRERE
ncbi:MAG TPA: CBS domain-containing protein [Acidothermaceae bacterium]|nr:CBS domain-containing protein [Acidothermaceae bacterium]